MAYSALKQSRHYRRCSTIPDSICLQCFRFFRAQVNQEVQKKEHGPEGMAEYTVDYGVDWSGTSWVTESARAHSYYSSKQVRQTGLLWLFPFWLFPFWSKSVLYNI